MSSASLAAVSPRASGLGARAVLTTRGANFAPTPGLSCTFAMGGEGVRTPYSSTPTSSRFFLASLSRLPFSRSSSSARVLASDNCLRSASCALASSGCSGLTSPAEGLES